MDSTGMPNYTQITEEVYDILKNAQAYEFNCRGKIKVKGKGDMTTYFFILDMDITKSLMKCMML